MGFPKRTHDPNARLDYPMDWSVWLPEGDLISAATVALAEDAPDDVLVIEADPEIVNGTVVIPWINSGTRGKEYDVTYHIATVAGREDDRSRTLVVKER